MLSQYQQNRPTVRRHWLTTPSPWVAELCASSLASSKLQDPVMSLFVPYVGDCEGFFVKIT